MRQRWASIFGDVAFMVVIVWVGCIWGESGGPLDVDFNFLEGVLDVLQSGVLTMVELQQ